MEAVGMGLLELIVLLAGSAGLPANDLASLVAADDYFAARSVALNADEMAKFAGTKNPDNPKSQLQQLLAIRWFGDNPALAKKHPEAQELLEQIATGKKHQDKHGFAKGHAAQALAKIAGKPIPPLSAMPKDSLRDALAWMPADMTMGGAYELRPRQPQKETALAMARKLLVKHVPKDERVKIYEMLDQVGNLRLDSATFGVLMKGGDEPESFGVRFAGRMDGERVADFLVAASEGKVQIEKKKGPDGQTIRLFKTGGRKQLPLLALVDDTDILLSQGEKAEESIDAMLQAKAGKKKSMVDGPFTALVKQIPAEARMAVLGELPEITRKELLGGKSPFRALPKQFLAHVVQGEKTQLQLNGDLADKDEAQAFADSVLGLKQMALKELDNLPPNDRVPPAILKRAKEALNAVKAEADGKTAKIKMTLDGSEILGDVLMWLLHSDPGLKNN